MKFNPVTRRDMIKASFAKDAIVFSQSPLFIFGGRVAASIFALAFVGLVAGTAIADVAQTDLDRRFRNTVHPFIETYCFGCHGKDKPKGDFDLRSFTSLESVTKGERHWKMVLDQLQEGQMPPEEAKRQPAPEARRLVVAWIKDVRAFEGRRNAGDPGMVLPRRLSNA